jgi:prepilin peptidase CpaA
MTEAVILVIFPFCMVYAAVSDMLSMTIANRVPVILAASFLVIAPFTGMDWSVYGLHVAAGALVLGVSFGFFALGVMGGGDAKLLAATAMWFGLGFNLIEYLIVASFFGGVLTLALLAFRSSAVADVTVNNVFLRHFADKKAGIPYAIALGLGGLVTYPDTALMQWALQRLAAGG